MSVHTDDEYPPVTLVSPARDFLEDYRDPTWAVLLQAHHPSYGQPVWSRVIALVFN